MNRAEVTKLGAFRDFIFVAAFAEFPKSWAFLGKNPTSLSISSPFQTKQFPKASQRMFQPLQIRHTVVALKVYSKSIRIPPVDQCWDNKQVYTYEREAMAEGFIDIWHSAPTKPHIV